MTNCLRATFLHKECGFFHEDKMLKPYQKLKGPLEIYYSLAGKNGETIDEYVDYPNGCLVGVVEHRGGPWPDVVKEAKDAILIVTDQHPKRCPDCQSQYCLHNQIGIGDLSYRINGKYHDLILCQCKQSMRYFAKEIYYNNIKDSKYRCVECGSPALKIKAIYKLKVKKGHERYHSFDPNKKGDERPLEKDMVFFHCINCKYDGIMILAKDEEGNYELDHLVEMWEMKETEDPLKEAIDTEMQWYHIKKMI